MTAYPARPSVVKPQQRHAAALALLPAHRIVEDPVDALREHVAGLPGGWTHILGADFARVVANVYGDRLLLQTGEIIREELARGEELYLTKGAGRSFARAKNGGQKTGRMGPDFTGPGAYLTRFAVDLDKPRDMAEAVAEVFRRVDAGKMPHPSAVKFSGVGLWVEWMIQPVPADKENARLHESIRRGLATLLRPPSSSPNLWGVCHASKTGGNGLYRLPGSVNAKSGNTVVLAVFDNVKRYSIPDLLPFAVKTPPQSKARIPAAHKPRRTTTRPRPGPKGHRGDAKRWRPSARLLRALLAGRAFRVPVGKRYFFVRGCLFALYFGEGRRTKARLLHALTGAVGEHLEQPEDYPFTVEEMRDTIAAFLEEVHRPRIDDEAEAYMLTRETFLSLLNVADDFDRLLALARDRGVYATPEARRSLAAFAFEQCPDRETATLRWEFSDRNERVTLAETHMADDPRGVRSRTVREWYCFLCAHGYAPSLSQVGRAVTKLRARK